MSALINTPSARKAVTPPFDPPPHSRLRRTRRLSLSLLSMFLLLGSLVLSTSPPAAAFGTSVSAPVPSVSAGGYMTCGVREDGTAACWGEDGVPTNDIANLHPGGASTPPAGVKFSEVNAGYATGCGIKLDQSIACWGSGRFEKVLRVPAGQFKHVVPGLNYVCALRTDDTITCWGGDDLGVDPDQKVIRDVPSGQFTQLSLGIRHACALRADGTIACWGHNTIFRGVNEGQLNVPAGSYKYVTSGNFTNCAIKAADDTPVCWGRTLFGQASYPTDASGSVLKFSTVSTGFAHVCGLLLSDKSVKCWGRNSEGQGSPVPPGAFTQVTTGTFHTCGMREGEKSAMCWGNNSGGRVQPNMTATQPHDAYVGQPYNMQFSMNTNPNPGGIGGTAAVKVWTSPAPTFTLVSGELPAGLTMGPNGQITGTPTGAGSSTIKVAASNGLSPADCAVPLVGGQSMPCTPGDTTSVATATRSFTINVGAEAPAPGDIAGRVTSSSDNSAIAGLTVSLAHNDGTPVGQATTDGNGNYAFTGLMPGPYNATASGSGVVNQTKPATVTSEQTTTVDFSLAPRSVRPTIVGVWNNHWQTATDGVYVEWSESFDVLSSPGSNYTVHAQPGCNDAPVATNVRHNWMGERPNTTKPYLPSRTRDLEMTGYENVVAGGTYYLKVAAGTEIGASTLQPNLEACHEYVAQLREMDRSTVTGKVTNASGPVAGATVTVTRTGGAPGTVAGQTTTDAAGVYTVENLPPSKVAIGGYDLPYNVTAAAPGMVSQTSPATTTFSVGNSTTPASSSTATLDFALKSLPVAANDAYTHYGSDTALVVAPPGVLGNDSDVDGEALTAAVVTGPARGALTANPDGSFSYRPAEDFVGTDSFTYKVNDVDGDSNVATVTITVGAGCQGKQATIVGTAGADRLHGTKGADVIAALGGKDSISGAGGNDVVCGGSGDDSLNLGGGDDYGDGGSGNDGVRGDVGNDTLIGGDGVDSLTGDDGTDLLSGGAGSVDTCNGGAGTDSLAPDHGCEKVNGVP